MSKKKRRSPSREKYDTEHPTVSTRIDRDIHTKLKAMGLLNSKKIGQIIRNALSGLEISSWNAYHQGYMDAMNRYAIHFPCGRCGIDMIAEGQQLNESIKAFIIENRWMHQQCAQQERVDPMKPFIDKVINWAIDKAFDG